MGNSIASLSSLQSCRREVPKTKKAKRLMLNPNKKSSLEQTKSKNNEIDYKSVIERKVGYQNFKEVSIKDLNVCLIEQKNETSEMKFIVFAKVMEKKFYQGKLHQIII